MHKTKVPHLSGNANFNFWPFLNEGLDLFNLLSNEE